MYFGNGVNARFYNRDFFVSWKRATPKFKRDYKGLKEGPVFSPAQMARSTQIVDLRR
jgi:hypothetical protein